MLYSPLRYPGGKRRLSKFIGQLCTNNSIDGHYIEPYAGGASVALYLLMTGKVEEITINDYDRSIYAFWWSILNRTNQFCAMVKDTEVSVENWKKMIKIQKNKKNSSLIQLGFSTFFLNRTNRSGIIRAGVMGGYDQKGKYKIDCRFNKKELIERIERIASYKNKIAIENMEAMQLIDKMEEKSRKTEAIFYFDPPYFIKGPELYMNSYKKDDHHKVAEKIKNLDWAHWIVSYDNHEEIRKLYDWVSGKKIVELSMSHLAYEKRIGEEVVFLSDSLRTIDISSIEKVLSK